MFTMDDLFDIATKIEKNGESVYTNAIEKIKDQDDNGKKPRKTSPHHAPPAPKKKPIVFEISTEDLAALSKRADCTSLSDVTSAGFLSRATSG